VEKEAHKKKEGKLGHETYSTDKSDPYVVPFRLTWRTGGGALNKKSLKKVEIFFPGRWGGREKAKDDRRKKKQKERKG